MWGKNKHQTNLNMPPQPSFASSPATSVFTRTAPWWPPRCWFPLAAPTWSADCGRLAFPGPSPLTDRLRAFCCAVEAEKGREEEEDAGWCPPRVPCFFRGPADAWALNPSMNCACCETESDWLRRRWAPLPGMPLPLPSSTLFEKAGP